MQISVYDEDGEVVGRVQDNCNLFKLNEKRCLGITKLMDGTLVLVKKTKVVGEKSHARVISHGDALHYIKQVKPKARREKLLKRFKLKSD